MKMHAEEYVLLTRVDSFLVREIRNCMLRTIFAYASKLISSKGDIKIHSKEYISSTKADSFHGHLMYILADEQLVS